MRVKLTLRSPEDERDVEVIAEGGATAGQLAPLFGGVLGAATGSLFNDGRLLSAQASLGEPGLRSGCVITMGAGTRRPSPADSALQLRVVSGPDSGRTIGLPRGRHLIGRSKEAQLDLADPDVSRRHAELRVELDGVSVRDLGSTNGSWLNGSRVPAAGCPIGQDDELRLGNSLLRLVTATDPPAALTADAAGRLRVHRPPAVAESGHDEPVEFPSEPVPTTRNRVPWLAGLAPAVLGVGCAILMHNSQLLVFALLSPVTILAGAAVDRREWRRNRRRTQAELARAEAGAREQLAARLAAEESRLHRDFPDAATVLHTSTVPDCRLWERRPGERRFLAVRLGLADRKADTRATRAGRLLAAEVLAGVPATVSLAEGALGLAGPLPLVRGAARWVVGQLLALHSPRDLSLVAFLDGEVDDWRWLRWPEATVRAVATEPSAHRSLSRNLRELVFERKARGTGTWSGPRVVVLLDRAGRFVALDDLRAVLEEGPAVGVTAVCLDTDVRVLPPSCRATAVLTSDNGSSTELRRAGQLTARAATECVSAEWADRLARSLAPLHDTDPADGAALPGEVWLADLLGGAQVSAQSLVDRWSRPGPAATPIGLTVAGPLEFDLVRDGPHLLVAGATGAGKSELLRSFVTGLALRHPPDDIAFVLIDYKGGAAFGGCAEFPHVVGLVTDLDGHLTSRALASLDAEIRRREITLAEAGVAEFEDYQRLPETRQRRLARLILVVDEFAHLAAELPTFLSGLVAVAQRGRSLGLHLVLATQRPAGVVSAQIKANVSARIALRVTDAADSTDVIGRAAASEISKNHPGRGFALLADGLSEFQTARTGQRLAPAESVTVTPLDPWHRVAAGPAGPPAGSGVEDGRPVQATMWQAVEQLGRAVPESPWLPPLPARLTTTDLGHDQAQPFRIRFGLTDDPRGQRQYPAVHDLLTGGSLGFIGGPRSGRTTALHTFLGQACRQLAPDQLHLYLLDCAGQSFRHFGRLPHCGAVVGHSEPNSIARLLTRLVEELADRQRLLAGLGLATLAEAHLTGTPLPVIVVALDGWEGLSALSDDHDAGRSAEALLRLARDGAAAGITVLVAGDRAMLGLRVAPALSRKLLLALVDRGDYLTAGVSPADLPARFEPGRAVAAGSGLGVQLALLVDDTGPGAQQAAVAALGTMDRPPTAGPAIRIRSLPVSVRRAELMAGPADRHRLYGPADEPADQPGHCLLGLGGDDARPVWAALFVDHARFLISGPPLSGRSTTAIVIAEQAWQAGLTMLVAAPARSPLADWAGQRGLDVLTPDDPPYPGRASDPGPGQLVLIDDTEQFTDTASGSYLTELATSHPAAVIAAGRAEDLMTSFRSPAVVIRRRRTGLLLQPGPADGELLGVRTGGQRMTPVPGRGLLVTDTTRRTAPDGLALQVAV
ncbi:FtsK/SpoIIIE domain-containing protein [Jatrophihabitans sp.]|uniref:FtsK/SpoIIIE domain-containing protein n=1 Tax=Jatrophihabitans sp. TaxID=1932789 RepID=UPI002C108395|nr:FtsK/SpoIIIE domain-containing protein [Jatrophihabitans sp.]